MTIFAKSVKKNGYALEGLKHGLVCGYPSRALPSQIAKIVKEGAGYKEVDGGNIFVSTDAWTAPVFSETGPDGNLWIADWYNPVIQHNPDKRGMDNQIWNDDKGDGNAHKNTHRDKGHGRIYIIKHDDGKNSKITEIDANDTDALLEGLESDNMFWRTTAQRLIVEEQKTTLIPDLIKLAGNEKNTDKTGINAPAIHALWTLKGLGALNGSNKEATKIVINALNSNSSGVKRAALSRGFVLRALLLIQDAILKKRLPVLRLTMAQKGLRG